MAYILDVLTTIAGCFYFLFLGLWVLLTDFILPVALLALAVLVVLLIVALVRTLIRGHKTSTYVPAPEKAREDEYTAKLSEMVKVETVSVFGQSDPDKFRELHKVMEAQFPTVFEKLDHRMKVAETDEGKELQARVDELMLLLNAYRTGAVTENP